MVLSEIVVTVIVVVVAASIVIIYLASWYDGRQKGMQDGSRLPNRTTPKAKGSEELSEEDLRGKGKT